MPSFSKKDDRNIIVIAVTITRIDYREKYSPNLIISTQRGRGIDSIARSIGETIRYGNLTFSAESANLRNK